MSKASERFKPRLTEVYDDGTMSFLCQGCEQFFLVNECSYMAHKQTCSKCLAKVEQVAR